MRLGLVVMIAAACGGPMRKTVRDAPVVAIVEAGAEPRRVLRYEPTRGLLEQAVTTTKAIIDVAMVNTTLDKIKPRLELPTVRQQLTFGVPEQRPSGELLITRRIDDMTLDTDGDRDPARRQRLEADAAKQKGTMKSAWMTPTGEITEAEADQPASIELRDLLALAAQGETLRFPDQPVGAGAVWRITSNPRVKGVQWNSVETVRLIGVAGDDVTLETELVMTAPPQDLIVQPNATTKLTSGKLRIASKLIVPLRRLVQTIYSESALELNATVRDHDLKITTSTTANTVVTQKPR